MLAASGIRKIFEKEKVLDDVSLDLLPGKVSAIHGPSGSGKSTLLRILALLDSYDAGVIALDGRPLSRVGTQVWPAITLVFQQQFLWPHLNLRDNLYLPMERSKENSRGVGLPLLEELEIEHLLDKRPWQLSVGERARAALARALLLEPRFLLLDEITAALDYERSSVVGAILKRFTASGGSVLLVTHDTDFSGRFADEEFRLERGRLRRIEDESSRLAVSGRE